MRCLVALLLLAAPPLCWAAGTDADTAPKRGACVYARPAAVAHAGQDMPRTRPAVPAAARSAPRPARGGGEADTSLAPRARATRWHSFLPGMFR